MINKGTFVCFGIVLVILLIARPVLPVWSGMTLLGIVIARANAEMSSPSAKRRWAGFKKMAAIAAFGFALVCIGLHLGSAPWDLKITTPAAARTALFSLLVYCASLIIAPGVIWGYMSTIRPQRRIQRRVKRVNTTLHGLAKNTRNARVGMAV